jgi:hypothetical protein
VVSVRAVLAVLCVALAMSGCADQGFATRALGLSPGDTMRSVFDPDYHSPSPPPHQDLTTLKPDQPAFGSDGRATCAYIASQRGSDAAVQGFAADVVASVVAQTEENCRRWRDRR